MGGVTFIDLSVPVHEPLEGEFEGELAKALATTTAYEDHTQSIGRVGPLMNPYEGERRHDRIGRVALGAACRVVGEDGRAAPARGELGRSGGPACR